ncbi:RagB/SusD family nutrient uptake outer membrane protein [Carboxylicivirga marina]|uniref:RagB/SusD family nutrient uptake outer membrane protein n=1 Tax=Carboxylicivirga marina TaxID=2800988 RepID=A0ABS1HP50_9BACT|nr:RagB/SusD family nutrient uptake outer membrane protein [Carboxylicivirga marina]MBK3519380.1 RagB/SusD family nutrient uptake outer membrane protein [Carboxylicivirga marina]
MEKNIKYILFAVVVLFLTACEDYLDLAPENDLSLEEVFQDFQNAQGWMDECYMYVVDYAQKSHWNSCFNLGDDAYCNNTWIYSTEMEKGNFAIWPNNNFNYFTEPGGGSTTAFNAKDRPGIWQGWEAIRKANIAIESIEEKGWMINASEAEKDAVLGQAYFFRAFFHMEIMKFWGRIPYVDVVLTGEEFKNYKRPDTYKECALKADQDLARAAELLPVDWDNHEAGDKTQGQNKGRVTKGAAYAFKGKNLLLAASPLMRESRDTYDYDQELCAMAVESFSEVLKLGDQGVYTLESFDNYEAVFYTEGGNPRVWPGGTEFIFSGPTNGSAYGVRQMSGVYQLTAYGGSGGWSVSPTHNYVQKNFGMIDGLSCEDSPLHNPLKPFENRDARFYKWLVIDGDQISVKNNTRIANLYVGGNGRFNGGDKNTSYTGYIIKKWYPLSFNSVDKNQNFSAYRLHMRLTDVYLMYAEAALMAHGISVNAPNYSLSAEGAINALRDRAGIPHVANRYKASVNSFMDEVRRERAVELSWEGHRWVDIRRWSLADLDEYKVKTELRFDKDHTYFEEAVLLTRVCEYPKHFWLPFEKSQTEIYKGFEQNPGW